MVSPSRMGPVDLRAALLCVRMKSLFEMHLHFGMHIRYNLGRAMKRMPFATGWLGPLGLVVAMVPPVVMAASGSEEPTVWGETGDQDMLA